MNVPTQLKVKQGQKNTTELQDALSKEQQWLEHCRMHLDTDLTKGSYVS